MISEDENITQALFNYEDGDISDESGDISDENGDMSEIHTPHDDGIRRNQSEEYYPEGQFIQESYMIQIYETQIQQQSDQLPFFQQKQIKGQSQSASGNKSNQILCRTRGSPLISDQVHQFNYLFFNIHFPAGRNIFETFYLFKQQLSHQYFTQCQCCYYKDYLIEISLTLTKYYLINQGFQEEVLYNTDQIRPIDFLKDLLIILNKYENEYADLLETVWYFLKGQEIQYIHQDFRRWQRFAKFFKKQLFINKSFYKSHNCNYRNYIVSDVQSRWAMDKEWFYMRDNQIIKGQDRIPQSKAGQKNFFELMKREQQKKQQGQQSNIGFFTLNFLFEQVKQNKKANSLIYADDIFNVIIRYDIIL